MGWHASWAYRVKLTIDKDDINAALSNFPVMVHLGTSVGRNGDDVSFIFDELESDANRKKIAVTTDDGLTQCYVEIEFWSHATENAWLWVKVPSIASDADTDLYLYFDKSKPNNTNYVGDIASTPGKAVWSNNYVLVSHQRDYSTTVVRDSGPNSIHGTKSAANQPTQVTAGRIGHAQDYESANSENVDHGAHASMFVSNITLEGWVNRDAANHRDPVCDRRWAGAPPEAYSFEVVAADRIQWWFKEDDGTTHGAWTSDSPVGTGWHKVVVTYDGANVRFYLDGDPDGVVPETAALTTASGSLFRTGVSWTVYADAVEDEIRLHSDAKPAAWIKASYESERDHLLDFGPQQQPYVEGSAAGSGIGTATTEGFRFAEGQASGSGVGTLASHADIIPAAYWLLIQEVPELRARIEELELALVPKAHYRL